MSVTIYDVARRAKVGIGTVSRVINNSPHLSPRTRARVLKTIRELKYQPHALAQGLARKKTNVIAAILPVFTGYFFLELLKGVQQEISKHQYNLLLYSVDHTDKIDDCLKKTLREKRVDGVLLISLRIPDAIASTFCQSEFPIVLIDSEHPNLDSIVVENKKGAFTATEHLIQLGHRRIGMIDGHLSSSPARVRLEGFREALREHRMSFDNRYLSISHLSDNLDGFNRESGYSAMSRLLALGSDRPTAVFVASDIQAAGAIRAIHEAGFSIPEDVAVVGFDDIELAEYLELTTVRQPMGEMGRLGVQRLMDRISGKKDDRVCIRFSPNLVIRRTCGALHEEAHDHRIHTG